MRRSCGVLSPQTHRRLVVVIVGLGLGELNAREGALLALLVPALGLRGRMHATMGTGRGRHTSVRAPKLIAPKQGNKD